MIIKLHFLFIFFLSFISIIASSSPPLNFTVYGTADVNHTSIILTQNLHNCTPNAHHSNIGRVFYKNPIRFLDSTFNSTVSFSTRFSFIIIPPPPPCIAATGEGIAFLITSDSNSLPHSVGCIGLPKSIDQFSSDSSFLAVEFDTNFDQDLGDINDNHVGIDLDSIFSVASVDLMSIGIDLKSGKRLTVWIEYRNSEKIIQIWVGSTRVKPENPILVAPLDLSKRFNGFMYVGFSGSNGRGSETYLIDNWRFRTSESEPPNFEVETVESENCLICFPEDSGSKDEQHKKGLLNKHHHSDKRVLELALGFLGLNLILILLTVCLIVLYVCLRHRSKKPAEESRICNGFRENRMPRRLKLSEIRSATKGFCRNQIVNEEVLAIVYKADFPSCGNVAVKRYKTGSFDGQFVTEFVKTVGSLRHKNLVQLHGWCCEKKELILVYEFIPNGSLYKILKNRTPNNSLSFESRLKILLGISSALVYLHEECEKPPIVHRNVKTSNVMLDSDSVPKLGDSGVGELYDRNSRARDGTLQAGEIGYLAPEYVFSGVPTVKTDVYSFGVVVLEVASGRPAVDDGGVMVTEWVWDLWEKKTLVGGADPTLMGRFNRKEMEKMLMVGLICVHPNYEMRPIMKEVVMMLQGGLVVNLPAEKPTVMIQSVVVERSPEVVVGCGGDDGVTSWGTPKSHFSKG